MSVLVETLSSRLVAKEPVAVVGGNTKNFLGGRLIDEPVSMRDRVFGAFAAAIVATYTAFARIFEALTGAEILEAEGAEH